MTLETFSWIAFNFFVFAMLALDLYVFHRKPHKIEYKEALIWSAVWIALALLFCLGLTFTHGTESALNFLAGFLLEKSLSIDNLFVFLMIFSYFSVPEPYRHTVLFWGILGALVMRAIFIFAGIILIQMFHWVIYLFGILLIFTGIKLAITHENEIQPEQNFVLKIFRKFFPITPNYEGKRFFIRKDKRLWATPLFVVLIVIETTDILFAIDSVPAILAITQDPFIVYTSNVFAIMGLRSIYFALAGLMQTFKYLHYGLAVLLVFIGTKMLISEFYRIPITFTLSFIALTLLLSIFLPRFFIRGSAP
ncbi:MAG: TerC family protein [Parachlamydiaceae bacterium]|nr:TerC family protein [Parachlamydiaceae bacterium]